MKKAAQPERKPLDYDRDRDLIAMYNFPNQVQRAIQEVQGIAGMIVYDGDVSEEEVSFLADWIKKHEAFAMRYPLSELKDRFTQIMKDGVVTEKERKGLFEFLSGIATGNKNNPVVDGIFARSPRISFKAKSFLFTGDMEFGSRQKAEGAVEERGGVVCSSCTLKTNYLVVGALGSEAYKYGRFGMKIEKALSMNKEKSAEIQIVREKDFVGALMGK